MKIWRDLRGIAIGAGCAFLIFYLIHRDEPHWSWSGIEAIGTWLGAIFSAAAAACAVWIASATRRQQIADREHDRAEKALALAFRLRPFFEEWSLRFTRTDYHRERSPAIEDRTWLRAVSITHVFVAPDEIVSAVPELGALCCRDDIVKALEMAREMSGMLNALLYVAMGGDERISAAFAELRELVEKALDCTAAKT